MYLVRSDYDGFHHHLSSHLCWDMNACAYYDTKRRIHSFRVAPLSRPYARPSSRIPFEWALGKVPSGISRRKCRYAPFFSGTLTSMSKPSGCLLFSSLRYYLLPVSRPHRRYDSACDAVILKSRRRNYGRGGRLDERGVVDDGVLFGFQSHPVGPRDSDEMDIQTRCLRSSHACTLHIHMS